MNNWRKLLWAMPLTAEEENTLPVDTFGKDVKEYILTNIDPEYDVTYFNHDFSDYVEEMQSTPIYLNHVLVYFKRGYSWFVQQTAQEVYDMKGV